MSLEQEMRAVLAEMSVLSDVAAATHEGKVRGGTPDRSPRGPNESLADEYRERFNAAPGPVSRRAVLDEARQALERARRMSIPEGQPPMPGDPLFKRWVAESELSSVELARLFGLSKRRINQIRQGYGTSEAA